MPRFNIEPDTNGFSLWLGTWCLFRNLTLDQAFELGSFKVS